MKKMLLFVVLAALVFSEAAFCGSAKTIKDMVGEEKYNSILNMNDPYANEGWSIQKYAVEGDLPLQIASHASVFEQMKIIPLTAVPEYLKGVYQDGDGSYKSVILSYNENPDDSGLIRIFQDPFTKNKDLTFQYRGDDFISAIDSNIGSVIAGLPVVQRAVLHGRFECILYDAAKYAADYYQSCLLTVVKDNGRIIWYDKGSELGDVSVTDFGRYMIACTDCTDYVTVTKDRIIAESYAGDRRFIGQNMKKPVSCRILTDNIVRLEYRDGCVEHWRVCVSDADAAKNKAKWATSKLHSPHSKHLIWSNGKGKGYIYRGSEEAWDYTEGEAEPVYKNMKDMSKLKNAPVIDSVPGVPQSSLLLGE
ncbi:MAG: hypothetical protein IJT95_04645 [Abditibacteriota bacterium]|nr:hypothetical protein [Abditibacteriota bacterium]